MSRNDEEDNDENESNPATDAFSLLSGKSDMTSQKSIPLCGCLTIEYYQPFFDIDTEDVIERLLHSLSYCRREKSFLILITDRADLYGPFWLATSLVFTIGVVTHLNGWIVAYMSGAAWSYDFQTVLTACTVIYSYVVTAPVLMWLTFRNYDKNAKVSIIACLYGYSISPFIPATVLCLIPSQVCTWISILLAAGISGFFLLKNLAPFIVSQAKNSAICILFCIIVMQMSFALAILFCFFV